MSIDSLSKRYRWIRFWFDESDNKINVDADAVIFPGTVGKECMQYVIRMSYIVEDALIQLKDVFAPLGADDGDAPSREEMLAMIEILRGMLDK